MYYERIIDYPFVAVGIRLIAGSLVFTPHMIYLALLAGCLFLYKGGDWLLDGMLGIGQRLNMSKAMVGLILVSLGTSAPELFVSVGSALQKHGGMAAGNVVGSNIINIAIVLGLTVCIVSLSIERVLQHQLLAVIALSLCTVAVTFDGQVTRFEGVLLIIAMLVSFIFAIGKSESQDERDDRTPADSISRSLLVTAGGIIALLIGAESLILGGLGLAEQLNVSETVVALTVTAIGTSLPEIAASIIAVARRDTSLALGNVIGSNLLNIGLVLGVSATVVPLQNTNLDSLTLVFFVGLATVIYAFSVKPGYLPKWCGYALLISYGVYITALINL